jgi:type VI secretion system secreted protein VgrG
LSLPIQLSIAGITLGRARVCQLRFSHDLGLPWRLHLEVAASNPDVDLERAIGAAVELVLPREVLARTLFGIIEGAQQSAVDVSGESMYLFDICPPLALLSRRRSQRIFRQQNAVATVSQILGEHGIAPPEHHLLEPHPKRDCTVQWRESDLDFALRVLAEEGVTLITDPRLDGPVRLVDDTRCGTEYVMSILGFRPDAGSLREGEPASVRAVTVGRWIEPGRVLTRDYDFEHPDVVPQAHAQHVPRRGASLVEGRLDVYEFQVGTFADDVGAHLEAQRRLQELRHRARTLRLMVNTLVPAGLRIRIAGHPRNDVDGEHLVIGSETQWCAGERSDVLLCIPASVPFRPRRLPKPRVQGAHTAVVVAADGKEVDIDEDGRVMVAFPWDRPELRGEAASRRVRIAQPWSGAGFGTLLPRRDEEVVVTYLDGDPDQPIIVGHVRNGASTGRVDVAPAR